MSQNGGFGGVVRFLLLGQSLVSRVLGGQQVNLVGQHLDSQLGGDFDQLLLLAGADSHGVQDFVLGQGGQMGDNGLEILSLSNGELLHNLGHSINLLKNVF